jgi:hypothetical protein
MHVTPLESFEWIGCGEGGWCVCLYFCWQPPSSIAGPCSMTSTLGVRAGIPMQCCWRLLGMWCVAASLHVHCCYVVVLMYAMHTGPFPGPPAKWGRVVRQGCASVVTWVACVPRRLEHWLGWAR